MISVSLPQPPINQKFWTLGDKVEAFYIYLPVSNGNTFQIEASQLLDR